MLHFFKKSKYQEKGLLHEGALEKQLLEKQHTHTHKKEKQQRMSELEEGILESNSVILQIRKEVQRRGMHGPKNKTCE